MRYPEKCPPIVVSGFESFNGRPLNSSVVVGQAMADGEPDIHFVEFPIRWGIPGERIARWPGPPRAWIALGEASVHFRLEALASNRRVAHLDNLGHLPPAPEVIPGAPPLLNSAPLGELAALLTSAGYPTTISDDAGAYLCNEIFYQLLHFKENKWRSETMVLFVHLPVIGSPVPGSPTDADPRPVADIPFFHLYARQLLRCVRAVLGMPENTPDHTNLPPPPMASTLKQNEYRNR